MKDLRRAAGDRWVDHRELLDWVVEQVGGEDLVAAHYYTGVPTHSEEGHARRTLTDLLADVERIPGMFVHRFPRHAGTWQCGSCHQVETFTREKRVDTSLVADMVYFAAIDAFDVAVLFSGDLDFAPAVETLHRMGKKVWVANFGKIGISKGLVRSAWSTLDLSENLTDFSSEPLGSGVASEAPADASELDDLVYRELARAEAHFGTGGGFVGGHYFVHRWKSHDLVADADARRGALERLIEDGRVERYEVEGKSAIRVVQEDDVLGFSDED